MVKKDGVVLCNAGHFDVEINKDDLGALSEATYEARQNVTAYRLRDGRVLVCSGQQRVCAAAGLGPGHGLGLYGGLRQIGKACQLTEVELLLRSLVVARSLHQFKQSQQLELFGLQQYA